jgi:molecular chaperone GrpE
MTAEASPRKTKIESGRIERMIENENIETVETAEETVSETAPKKRGKKQAEIDALKAELEARSTELALLNDKYLRMAAEYDNFRRRSAKEREGVYTEAYGDAIAQVLPVIDNMERAALYSDAEKVAEGVKMTLKSFSDILERMGITSFGEPGDAFDPVLHNAVMHVEDETLGESVIKEVFQKGYKKGDKVIRYAMVIVAN